jgi:hypothetical protein
LYAIAGLGLGVAGRQEVYPVFSWSLFSRIPNNQSWFAVRLLTQRGEGLADAPFFEEAAGLVRNPQSIAAQHVIRRLGNAVVRGDSVEEADARRLLEEVYLVPDLEYELVRIEFDPLRRWQDREQHVEPIKRYSTARVSR